ncbi:sperm microtubule associated protein 2-like isoform X4 [Paroedura picta]|uniref:sperm microtubule associated protein 2-like isoform X4 n=1 Tax=Paroedura picta TaxID=143630 RepID=UPI0040579F0A
MGGVRAEPSPSARAVWLPGRPKAAAAAPRRAQARAFRADGKAQLVDASSSLRFGSGDGRRLQQLAEPKKVKDVWNYSSRLVWGNQETIWPLPRRAVTGLPPARILDLAKPKKNFAQKPQPRPSIVLSYEIWEHPMNTHDSMPSERILHLSEPKQCSPVYLEQRPRSSPLWHINPPALSCTPSQRILNLSQPRTLSPSFILPKEGLDQLCTIQPRSLYGEGDGNKRTLHRSAQKASRTNYALSPFTGGV